jgi:hypothetical protein
MQIKSELSLEDDSEVIKNLLVLDLRFSEQSPVCSVSVSKEHITSMFKVKE